MKFPPTDVSTIVAVFRVASDELKVPYGVKDITPATFFILTNIVMDAESDPSVSLTIDIFKLILKDVPTATGITRMLVFATPTMVTLFPKKV